MNRRGFLGALAASAAAFALYPERALWVPGAKTISIPKSLTEALFIEHYVIPFLAASPCEFRAMYPQHLKRKTVYLSFFPYSAD